MKQERPTYTESVIANTKKKKDEIESKIEAAKKDKDIKCTKIDKSIYQLSQSLELIKNPQLRGLDIKEQLKVSLLSDLAETQNSELIKTLIKEICSNFDSLKYTIDKPVGDHIVDEIEESSANPDPSSMQLVAGDNPIEPGLDELSTQANDTNLANPFNQKDEAIVAESKQPIAHLNLSGSTETVDGQSEKKTSTQKFRSFLNKVKNFVTKPFVPKKNKPQG